jgi:uncharacterized protein (TIGR00661 family)
MRRTSRRVERGMRILYGVTGEGLGHTMRARVLIQHLEARGHAVRVAASGRAVDILRRHQVDVIAIRGLELVQLRGALERARTLGRNARRAPGALAHNGRAALAAAAFDPDVVITDFDSFTYLVGRWLARPIVSVDHQHVLSRFLHPRRILRELSYDFPLARGVVRRKLPRCDRYIVTSFFFPEVRGECAATTRLVGPIVRPELDALALAPVPANGEHVLVYQTGSGDPRLLAMLHALRGFRFRVYGATPRAAAPAHVEYRPFSEAGFLADLASARAVVANGGYTTLSEALHLGKPVLSIPIRHQGEQELNAAYLSADGLGERLRLRGATTRELHAALERIATRARPPAVRRAARAQHALDDALAELS